MPSANNIPEVRFLELVVKGYKQNERPESEYKHKKKEEKKRRVKDPLMKENL